MTPTAGGQKQNPAVLNAQARALILAKAVPMEQQIFSTTYSAPTGQNISSSQPIVTVQPRYVGLGKGFWVNVQATITNGSAVILDLADMGPANLLSQIQFNDLANQTRIQTTGFHMAFLNAIRARRPFDAALVNTTGFASGTANGDDTYPIAYGDNFIGQIYAPATIAAAADSVPGTGVVNMWWWIPLAYSDQDLRGSVYLNVVNATAQLNLTFNPVPVVATGTDSTNAIYVGASSGSVATAVISSATVTVYQSYLDQLPRSQQTGQVVLPTLDLATMYELKNTTLSSVIAGQDFPIQYANFRDFMSVFAVYVNTGSTGARGNGSDINYWALQSANFTNIWKRQPNLQAMQTRHALQTDLPKGCWYFPSREKPISTTQYGNMQLILNAITAGAGAYIQLGWEDFALINQIATASSLPAS
jgi:P3 major capsid protein